MSHDATTLLADYICTNCKFALFADHPFDEKWLKCVSCGFCRLKKEPDKK